MYLDLDKVGKRLALRFPYTQLIQNRSYFVARQHHWQLLRFPGANNGSELKEVYDDRYGRPTGEKDFGKFVEEV